MTKLTFIMIFGLPLVYWALAYAALILYALGKLYAAPEDQRLSKAFKRRDMIVVIMSAIGIPCILIMLQDPAMKAWLPLNYVTSFLAGYQTQSFIRFVVNISAKKYLYKKDDNTTETNSDNTSDTP